MGRRGPAIPARYFQPGIRLRSGYVMKLRSVNRAAGESHQGFSRARSVDSLVLAPLPAHPAGLHQHQSQEQTSVSATVAIAAAHRILE
jgi:hypothetical protein